MTTVKKKIQKKNLKKSSPPPKKIAPKSTPKHSAKNFPIVGIGASAGGLEAFIELFSAMPADTGMAFVLVQHLEPSHVSMSADIISRSTSLKVQEVKDGTRIEPNQVYIIPPNHNMAVSGGILKLLPSKKSAGPRMTIDYFFESLARAEKSRVIGVVLSGTGSDASLGLRAIKNEGGVTFAQEPTSAKYTFMPQNAISAGVVDLVLSPRDIAKELAFMATNPYLISKKNVALDDELQSEDAAPFLTDKNFQLIFKLLMTHANVDFSQYKHATIARRIERRMVVQKTNDVTEYAQYIKSHPEEVLALYNDILINVTEFFRDPEAHKNLVKEVYPRLLSGKTSKTPIRIWVAGCATGEEVYSIAISLLEYLEEHGARNPLQIFATDISDQCIQSAREGVYSENIALNVSPERLNRFFERVHEGYKVHKSLRDLCLFSRHDVTNDPPFSRLDLISCRNLLIYLGVELQKRVIPLFHYALNPSGFLWLGMSETPNAAPKLFNAVNKSSKIFSRVDRPVGNFRFAPRLYNRHPGAPLPEKSVVIPPPLSSPGFLKDADKIILSRYAPPGVIVNADMEILQFRGRVSTFLEPASGKPSSSLFKMARPEIISGLRAVIQRCKKENKGVSKEILNYSDGESKTLSIEVLPTNPLAPAKDRTYLILFEELKSGSAKTAGKKSDKKASPKKTLELSRQITEFQQELAETKNYQTALTEQYDISQEELTSTIEELQSTNEELQSTNEEMETAKEELQSTNEELTTVNDELQIRNNDLVAVGSDLNNLLVSTEIPILMVGNDRRIRRFTPKAEAAFNLIPSDIGRPVGHIKTPFGLDFEALISEVNRHLIPKEVEVQDQQGSWKRVQIRPYKTNDNKIDGAIVALVDIETLKQREIISHEALDYISSIYESVPLPLIILSKNFHFNSANQAFYKLFQINAISQAKEIFRIFESQLGSKLSELADGKLILSDFEITREFPRIGTRNFLLSASVIKDNSNDQTMMLSCVDVTERNMLLRREQEARQEAERANRTKDLFLATLSHELRTPLSSILTWAQLISQGKVDFAKAKEGAFVIEQSAKTQNQLIDDLLDISRITMGKLALDIKEINPASSVQAAIDAVVPMAQKKNIEIKVLITTEKSVMLGDPVRLQQIVWNLLTNAIKFSPRDCPIEVRLDSVGKNLQIQVIDCGKGIPVAFIPDIFKRFSQADSTSTRMHGGLGLGLAIVHSLVELQGGSVTADNGPTTGAIFTVLFPQTSSNTSIVQNDPARSQDTGFVASEIKDLRILFVEDDESTREAMAIYLKSFGVDLRVAENAEQALKLFAEFQPQVLMSDIAMPGENGYDLIRKIRKLKAEDGGLVPAMALTAYATAEDANLAMEAGFDMHTAKPVEVNDLVRRILKLSQKK